MRIKNLAVLAVLCVAMGAAALDVPLEYERYPDNRGGEYRPFARAGVEVQAEQPPGDWKLPELLSAIPVYAAVKHADAERLLILDRQKKEDAFFTRMYFDANGNRDLTDDPPLDCEDNPSGGNFSSVSFKPMDIQTAIDGKPVPYSLRVSCYCWRDEGQKELTREILERQCQVMADVNCAYRGQVSLDGTAYYVTLADADGNARFDNRAEVVLPENHPEGQPIVPRGDHLYLGVTPGAGHYDAMPLGKWLSLGGRLYEVTVDIPGKKLVLAPAAVPMARVKLSMEAERLTLFTRDDGQGVMLFRPGRTAMIPEGTYGVLAYTALRNDEQGDLWRVVAAGTTDTPFVEVKGAQGTPLAFGEPYTPEAAIDSRQRRNVRDGAADIPMELAVKGSAGEQVGDISHLQGNKTKIALSGNRPKEAKFKIVKPGGEVAAQGQFDYG